MSRLTSLQRKAALLRFYLRKEDRYPTNVKHTVPLVGMTRAGFEKWITGETVKPRRLAEIEQKLKQALNLDAPAPDLLTEQTGVMALGKLLGLTRRECQLAIDQVAGELGPTFSAFSMKAAQARTMLRLFEGLYRIYRIEETNAAREATEREQSIMCMAMSVRYSLPGSKVLSASESRIRCKLNIPAYRLPVETHEYDGYLTPADSAGRFYWLFEIRAEVEKDMVFLMTETLQRSRKDGKDRQIAHGIMVSRTQDAPSIPAIWPIIVEKAGALERDDAAEDFENTEEKRFVREEARLLDPQEVDPWIFEALRKAETFASFFKA